MATKKTAGTAHAEALLDQTQFGYRCVRCKTAFHADHVELWGRTKDSSLYGPVPKCTNLVKDGLGSNAVCGGQLVAFETDDPDDLRKPERL